MLQVLRRGTSGFDAHGYHTCFYPVELPPWLPDGDMAEMVSRFSEHLRRELLLFRRRGEQARLRHVKDSQSISSIHSNVTSGSLEEYTPGD